MPSLKDVRIKIGAVKKTKQITKAMNMVASAKLRGAQSRIERFRPYADKFYDMLGELAGGVDPSVHPLLQTREVVATTAIVLMTSDRGLCGAFNTNLITKAMRLAKAKTAEGKAVKFICVGKKGRDAVRKSDYELVSAYTDEMNSFDFNLASRLGVEVIGGYVSGAFDEVIMLYGRFLSIARQEAEELAVLPVTPTVSEEPKGEYIYEPSIEGLLSELLPRFVNVSLYRGLLDTSTSEHAARMRSMDNATRNCDDLVASLTLVFNKARQAAITKELMDIVGGTEALKG